MKVEQALGFVRQMIHSETLNGSLHTWLGPSDFPKLKSWNQGDTWRLENPKPIAELLRDIADALDPPIYET